MSTEQARIAIEASMAQNSAIFGALGNPLRLYDAPVKQAAFPYAIWRRWETRPIGADYETAQEHIATLEIHCRDVGVIEARKAVEAVQIWAATAKPVSNDIKITLLLSAYADVFRAVDGRTFLGLVRLKLITEKL